MQLCSACRRHVKVAPCPFCGELELRSSAALLLAVAAVSVGCTQPTQPNDEQRKPGQIALDAGAAHLQLEEDAGNPRFRAPSAAGGYGAPPSQRK